MLSSKSLLSQEYPPSPPLSSFRSPSMSKTSVLSNPWSSSNNNRSPSTEPPSFLNLEKVVQTYGSQPELLELILSSKVEEDRRRAEEAKLRRKEIDYLLQQKQESTAEQQQQQPKKYHTIEQKEKTYHSLPPISSSTNFHHARMNSLSSTGSLESGLPRLQQHSSYHHRDSSPSINTWRHTTATPQYLNRPPSPSPKRKNSSNIEMLLIPSPKSLELKLPELSTTMKQMNSVQSSSSNDSNSKRVRSSPSSSLEDDSEAEEDEVTTTAAAGSASNTPINNKAGTVNKRRRREMQAITTIIETREFPYNDDFLWKNNGNTVHKKTGFKSIYYKCSNSSKGCPVNKTVTFKDNGEHLIKYRGQHLQECNRIKRITDL